MPKETFLNLSKEKQEKILGAAKKEFKRVPLEQASIKNIVEEAGIARGSFYQYFYSKEDLIGYIINNHFKTANEKMKKQILESKGDIFKIFIAMYDLMDNNCLENENVEFFKNIFENIKTSEETKIIQKFIQEKPKKIKDYYEYIDKTNLNINSKEDFETVEKILFTITTKAIVMRLKYSSKEEARNSYLKQLEYLKYGIMRGEKTC